MRVTSELFEFPFKDEEWRSKALIGGLIGVVGIFLFPVLFLLYGFGLRTMRQTIRGEEPTLPDWDDWSQIITDSLWWVAVTLVYTLPFTILVCAMLGFLFLAFFLPVLGTMPQSSQGFDPSTMFMFTAITIWSLAIGLASLISFPLQFLAMVGLTRAVAHNSLGSAFQFREVWALTRAGFSNFVIAFMVYYGILFGTSMIAVLLGYTIILSCLYPVILGLGVMYTSVLMGALYGRAYRETQETFATAGVIA